MGNVEPDDGWTYRGSGMLQTTGRYNYRLAGYESAPDALRTADGALDSALDFWKRHSCNQLADDCQTVRLRKVINGGDIGVGEVKTTRREGGHRARLSRYFRGRPRLSRYFRLIHHSPLQRA